MENKESEQEYDLSKIYVYKEFPDKISGRCDNCGNTSFKSSVKDFIFLRECRQCGMKKIIYSPIRGFFFIKYIEI
jgi:rubredoxin